jgi:hypothetical protein
MSGSRKKGVYDRVIVTLPRPLASRLRRYAEIFRQGNKSGFVADAVEAHIEHLRKVRNTARLREAYAASADAGASIAREWEQIDDESWRKLDKLENASREKKK